MAVRSWVAGRPEIKISGKAVVHPDSNRFAKTAHHDAHGNYHRDGSRERAD
jgi:hypothetical protein